MNKYLSLAFFLLALAASATHAQQPPPETGSEFLAILPDCLAAPPADVHECAATYAQAVEPASVVDLALGDPPVIVRSSVVKGKYNTCHMYPASPELKGLSKGYACFNNSSGKCVSGDCCDDPFTSC